MSGEYTRCPVTIAPFPSSCKKRRIYTSRFLPTSNMCAHIPHAPHMALSFSTVEESFASGDFSAHVGEPSLLDLARKYSYSVGLARISNNLSRDCPLLGARCNDPQGIRYRIGASDRDPGNVPCTSKCRMADGGHTRAEFPMRAPRIPRPRSCNL